MSDDAKPDTAADGIEQGKRLIRLGSDRGLSLAERLSERFARLTWRTPIHGLRLRGRYPEAWFALLGPPDPSPAGVDAAQVEQWRREGAIRYLGEARDVRPYLAAASVFVLPSWYREGLPRTILEAMATGRAVVTTDMPGCREPIDPGVNGYIVPPRDAEALAMAMERFLLRPELVARMGGRARETAVERFSVERVNDILLSTMRLRADVPSRPSGRGAAAALAGVAS